MDSFSTDTHLPLGNFNAYLDLSFIFLLLFLFLLYIRMLRINYYIY
jgi:hypothetical protein